MIRNYCEMSPLKIFILFTIILIMDYLDRISTPNLSQVYLSLFLKDSQEPHFHWGFNGSVSFVYSMCLIDTEKREQFCPYDSYVIGSIAALMINAE